MRVHWTQRFPERAKPQIVDIVTRLADLWGFADYEVHVNLKCPKDSFAEVNVLREAKAIWLQLDRRRLEPDLLERDLYHELLHVPMWELFNALETMIALVPKDRRRAATKMVEEAFENSHETMAQLWMRALGRPQ